MKKFNAARIATELNKRMAAGVGFGSSKAKFEVCGSYVTAVDFDRGGKHCDMDAEYVEADLKIYRKKYAKVTEFIIWTLKEKGYAVKADLHMDEKGFCFIDVEAAPGTKVTKPAPAIKASEFTPRNKGGVIAHIVKMLTEGEWTKEAIVFSLAATFPERDANKMKATVNAQVPARLKKEKGLNVVKTDNGFTIK